MVEEGVTYAIVVEGDLQAWGGACRNVRNMYAWAALVKTPGEGWCPVFHAKDAADIAALSEYLAKQAEREASNNSRARSKLV